jgi:hypothetical protein
MRVPFPPGDVSWKKTRPHSAWREFKFAFSQVCRAIEPEFPLAEMIAKWNEISRRLAENPRKRTLQLTQYFDT